MMTVLQIVPSLDGGGSEQATIDIAAALVAAGHRAIAVSSGGRGATKITASGGTHILRDVATKNPLAIIANAFWLAGLMRREHVAIVHARSRAPAWSAWIAARMTGAAFVTTFHAAYKFSTAPKKFYNSVMARADRIIAISHFIAAHIRETYGAAAKIRVIPRGIDLSRFKPELVTDERMAALRAAWGLNTNDAVILCPARLSPIKGHRVLIEAMAQLPPAAANVVAIIVGSDQGRSAYRQELLDLIAARGLQGKVRLVDHCDDMPASYRLASVVAATSLVAEGFGRVPVEAMAMGVPVVATKLGGFIETIRDGATGWLAPPGDAAALAVALTSALALLPERRRTLAEAAMNEARAHYDLRQMAAATLAVYAELFDVRSGVEYPPSNSPLKGGRTSAVPVSSDFFKLDRWNSSPLEGEGGGGCATQAPKLDIKESKP